MSSFFRTTRKDKKRYALGDKRTVHKIFIVLRIGNETRGFGKERVHQEYVRGYCDAGPETKSFPCLKWRNVDWVDNYTRAKLSVFTKIFLFWSGWVIALIVGSNV